jgi:hypothetical protein
MLLTLLLGCWMDSSSLPALNIDVINFTNEYLEADKTVVYLLDSSLTCPDGEPAPFFFVDPGNADPGPVAVVFHSGAFDYKDPIEEGQSFDPAGRLLSDWSSSRIWETLNLSRQVLDTAVTDLGYLPTALANAGVAQIYPSNCWGDIWHNGSQIQPNNSDSEGYSRQGLDMADFTLKVLTDATLAEESGFEFIQAAIDPTQVMWVGLGSGGQAIIELLSQGNAAPSAVLFDSVPADWTPYLSGDFGYEQEGLNRIFGSELPIDFSLDADLLPQRTGWIWSNGDSQHPVDTLRSGATLVESIGGWVVDTNTVGHIFSNQDWSLAQSSVNYMLNGTAESDENTEVDTASE